MTTSGFQSGPEQTVEGLMRRIAVLVAERQELRDRSDLGAELEANRLEIVRCQLSLNHALIQQHSRKAA
jgi:hypothetical protein